MNHRCLSLVLTCVSMWFLLTSHFPKVVRLRHMLRQVTVYLPSSNKTLTCRTRLHLTRMSRVLSSSLVPYRKDHPKYPMDTNWEQTVSPQAIFLPWKKVASTLKCHLYLVIPPCVVTQTRVPKSYRHQPYRRVCQ